MRVARANYGVGVLSCSILLCSLFPSYYYHYYYYSLLSPSMSTGQSACNAAGTTVINTS